MAKRERPRWRERRDPDAQWRRPESHTKVPSTDDTAEHETQVASPPGTSRVGSPTSGRREEADDHMWRPDPDGAGAALAERLPEPATSHPGAEGDTSPILAGEDLVRTYAGSNGVTALRGVSIAARPGDFMALMGPSGSGKTTLLGLLSGLDRPEEGRVLWRGRPMESLSPEETRTLRRGEIGVVFQSFGLLPTLSARENVELPLRVAGIDLDELGDRATALLTRLGLGDRLDNRTFELSAGQQQRVAVARALIVEPDVLLADEPIAEVDSENADLILDALADVARRGGAVVAATHNPAALAYAGVVVLLRDGRIEAQGSPDDVAPQVSTD